MEKRKPYIKPEVTMVAIDNEISVVLMSEPVLPQHLGNSETGFGNGPTAPGS